MSRQQKIKQCYMIGTHWQGSSWRLVAAGFKLTLIETSRNQQKKIQNSPTFPTISNFMAPAGEISRVLHRCSHRCATAATITGTITGVITGVSQLLSWQVLSQVLSSQVCHNCYHDRYYHRCYHRCVTAAIMTGTITGVIITGVSQLLPWQVLSQV